MKKSQSKYFIPTFLLQEEKTQKITTLVLTMIALMLFGFFAIGPTLSTIAGLRRQLTDASLVNEKLQEKIKALSLLQQQYTQIQSDIPFVTSAIPQTPQIPYFSAQLQQLAKNANVQITSLQIYQVELVPKIATDKSITIPFSLDVSGDQSSIMTFLTSLTSLNRIVTMDSLTVANDAAKNVLTLSIKGNAYFKK